MPKVGNKHFPYTPAGKKAAAKAKKKKKKLGPVGAANKRFKTKYGLK